MGRIDTVFFDAGNTLFDLRQKGQSPEWVRGKIYADVARRYGCKITDSEMTECMMEIIRKMPERVDGAFRYSVRWFRVYIERLFERVGGVSSPRAAMQDLYTYFRNTENFYVFQDALPALRKLRDRGMRIGIISNWSPTLPIVLHGLGIGPYLDDITVSATAELEKPDHAIFQKAMNALDTKPGSAIHVGDNYKADYAGAKNAGLRALLVDRPGDHAQAAELGGDRIRSLEEIFRILDDGK